MIPQDPDNSPGRTPPDDCDGRLLATITANAAMAASRTAASEALGLTSVEGNRSPFTGGSALAAPAAPRLFTLSRGALVIAVILAALLPLMAATLVALLLLDFLLGHRLSSLPSST